MPRHVKLPRAVLTVMLFRSVFQQRADVGQIRAARILRQVVKEAVRPIASQNHRITPPIYIPPSRIEDNTSMTDLQQLEQFFLSRHPLVAIQTFEEEYVLPLIRELSVQPQPPLSASTVTDP